jgi:2-amino-4-hydroxy-6-hydroxymethyldihydropteridine diphosphokinase
MKIEKPVALALGSNLGDTGKILKKAIDYLSCETLDTICSSSFHSSRPVDCKPGANDFLNAAVTGFTTLSAAELLTKCQEIEVKMGRPAEHGYHDNRIIDIDILLYDDLVIDSPRLKIPHPGLRKRKFVLRPLVEIAPDWLVYPDQKTVKDFYDTLLA